MIGTEALGGGARNFRFAIFEVRKRDGLAAPLHARRTVARLTPFLCDAPVVPAEILDSAQALAAAPESRAAADVV